MEIPAREAYSASPRPFAGVCRLRLLSRTVTGYASIADMPREGQELTQDEGGVMLEEIRTGIYYPFRYVSIHEVWKCVPSSNGARNG